MVSLEIIVTRHAHVAVEPDDRRLAWRHATVEHISSEKIFHIQVSEEDLVRHAYQVIVGLERAGRSMPENASPYYRYWLRFSGDDGLTTLLYRGDSNTGGWERYDTVRLYGVRSPHHGAGRAMMQALHVQFGMPFWRSEAAPDADDSSSLSPPQRRNG
jgi:hypothetical protein